MTCFTWLEALGRDRATAIQRFNRETGSFDTCAFAVEGEGAAATGRNFTILRGEGYRISSPTGGALQLPGCTED